MKAYFHSVDLDGHCSGAIVKYKYPHCEMIGINYGDKFVWEDIQKQETIFLVDFSLPMEDMEKLYKISFLHWIDHHATAIDESLKNKFYPYGVRENGTGACELTWRYLFQDVPVPYAVKLLADYDVWKHDNPDVLPFQYGFRMKKDTWPDNQKLWSMYFTPEILSGKQIQHTIDIGQTILDYENSQNEKFCKSYYFETKMPESPQAISIGSKFYNAVCVNRGFTNSKVFDSVWDESKHDMMITFCRKNKKWLVSLYTEKENVHCGEIAKSFGGGGHQKAAGFQCEELPFEY